MATGRLSTAVAAALDEELGAECTRKSFNSVWYFEAECEDETGYGGDILVRRESGRDAPWGPINLTDIDHDDYQLRNGDDLPEVEIPEGSMAHAIQLLEKSRQFRFARWRENWRVGRRVVEGNEVLWMYTSRDSDAGFIWAGFCVQDHFADDAVEYLADTLAAD